MKKLFIVYHERPEYKGSFIYGVFESFQIALEHANEVITLGWKEPTIEFPNDTVNAEITMKDGARLHIKQYELNKSLF
jgi:hypothetical protein